MNYKIIHDEEMLKGFIDDLPNLLDNEVYYLSLFARKKYAKDLIKSNDKTQLLRFIANKENMFRKIKELERPLGAWYLKEISAPQESLVLYIHMNPRCMKKATYLLGQSCWKLIENKNYNLINETISCIHKSKSKSGRFITFDIDTKNIDLNLLCNIFPGLMCYKIIETRGGYHVVVNGYKADKWIQYFNKEKGMQFNKSWYLKMIETFPVDAGGDKLNPVPGTIQGNFNVKLI